MSELKEALINISEEVRTKVIPENIKAGVQIFDTEGEYTGIDTSDATATAEDIAKDKTAYVNGEKIVGTMEAGSGAYNVELYIPSQYATQFSFISLLKKVDLSNINTGQLLNFASAFARASDVIEIKGIDVRRATTLNSMFYQCGNLVHIPVLNPASVKSDNSLTGMFDGCPKLSDESLNNILQMCVNAIVYTGTKTLKQIGLTAEQATKCQTLPNYQAFLDAGWTTGY